MSRISAALAAAFGADPVPIFLLAQLAFDSGTVRLTTWTTDIVWNGVTWLAAGGLLRFDIPEETGEVRATGGTLSLSGLDPAYLALADTENYHGRPATLYLGAFDAAGAVVVDPDTAFAGFVDTMELQDEGGTAMIAVALETAAAAGDRPNERRYMPEDQALRFAGDKGFEFVTAIQTIDLHWGGS